MRELKEIQASDPRNGKRHRDEEGGGEEGQGQKNYRGIKGKAGNKRGKGGRSNRPR